jgi:drug/metabolite transporter (DMT)-like permease
MACRSMRPNLIAALMMTLAMAGFAVEDAIIKHLAQSLPVGQIMGVIGLLGAAGFGLLARRSGLRLADPAALRGATLLRNLAEMTAATCFTLAIALAPLATVTAILQTAPLMVTLGAAVVLREPVGWRRWSAIVVGFAGVMIILRPGSPAFEPAALMAVLGVAGIAVRDLATRRIAAAVHGLQLSVWGFAMLLPAGLILLALEERGPRDPGAQGWLWLGAAAAAGMLAYAALIRSTRTGDVAAVTPFRYTRLVFAMAIGIAVFGERPDAATLAGSALIVAAGLYTLWREIVRRPAPSAPAAARL